MTALQEFPLFPKLPRELREAIWEFALPARVVKLQEEELHSWEWLRQQEELQYYADLYGFRKVYGYKDFEVHKNGFRYEEVYGPSDLLGYRALYYDMKYGEDSRSTQEKDLRMMAHTMARADGGLKRQTQLPRFGFTSFRTIPNIGHVPPEERSIDQDFSDNGTPHFPLGRDFNSLLHNKHPSVLQIQLERYGFASSRSAPTLRRILWDTQTGKRPSTHFYSHLEYPTLLQACSESRKVALRTGYVLSFASYYSPARTWFNPHRDFLYLDEPAGRLRNWERHLSPENLRLGDRRRVRNFIVDYPDPWSSVSYQECLGPLAKHFENLENFLILTMDQTGRQHRFHKPFTIDSAVLIDADEADVFAPFSNDFMPGFPYPLKRLMRNHHKTHLTCSPFYTKHARDVEVAMADYGQALGRDLKVPKVHFVILTNAQNAKELLDRRQRYWHLKERLAQKPPCLFDLQFADEIEARDLVEAEY